MTSLKQLTAFQDSVLVSGYLGALVQEGVPQRQQDVAGQTLHKNHQEPVEGDERHVNAVILEVSRQPGELLHQEVLQNSLVSLHATHTVNDQSMTPINRTNDQLHIHRDQFTDEAFMSAGKDEEDGMRV